jgi:PhoPQ-activated pathogenicity-related protein
MDIDSSFIASFGDTQLTTITPCYHNLSEVLSCYLNIEEPVYSFKEEKSSFDEVTKVTTRTYILTSQTWPKATLHKEQIWQHRLTIYEPERLKHKSALIFVNGGYNLNKDGKPELASSKESLDLIKIANSNQMVTVMLEDVPNQFLFFEDEKPRKEDEILAYTYKKVLEDPYNNAYYAGHLPMAKSVTKTMDAIQAILGETKIEDFVLTGASKRG